MSSRSVSKTTKAKSKKSTARAKNNSSTRSKATPTPKKRSSTAPARSSKKATVKAATPKKHKPGPTERKRTRAEQETAKDRTPDLETVRANYIPPLAVWESLVAPAKPLRAMAFDPGKTNLAIAFLDLEHQSHLESKVSSPELTNHNAHCLYLERVVEYWVKMFHPEVIFVEGVAYGATHGVAEAGKLQYIIFRAGIEWGIPVIIISNGTMRKYLNAVGDDTKSDTKLRVFQKYGIEFTSSDECDAYAIAQTGLAFIAGEIDIKGKKYPAKKE